MVKMENWFRVRRFWLLAAALGVGCALPAPSPVGGTAPAEPPVPSAVTTVEQGVFTEVNRARQQQGVSALLRDAALDVAARSHARELAARNTLDHNSVNEARRTPGMRVTAAGVTWTSVAENLASMSGSGVRVPQQTAGMWLDSPGHRTNMLNARYTHTGVGAAVDGRGNWYVTQLYVLPR
jgi:uncharacterized protein YkwD